MKQNFRWQAFSNHDRNSVIEEVKDAISKSDGYIVNFNMYSDLALSIVVEIEENQIDKLHSALGDKLSVSPEKLEGVNRRSGKECLILLNVSFGRGKGNLKNEIPSVPG